jgi:hypothetical protein
MITLMLVKDAVIVGLIEQISDHYQSNIASRYIRPLLLQLPIDKETWDAIDSFVGNVEYFQYQGFVPEELYRQIIALAHFIDTIRRQLLPGLRNRAAGLSGPDKVLRNMAVNTFPSNLAVLGTKTSLLLRKLRELDDREAKTAPPVYTRFPALENLEALLEV